MLTSKPGARLVAARLFPDAKEVTESYGVRQALVHFPAFSPADRDVLLVSVGDGTTPRTAATFAVTSRWDCHAVDPRLRARGGWSSFDRLTIHRSQIEDVEFTAAAAVVVMVHAHVDASTVLRSVTADRLLLVCLPCCVQPGLELPPDVRYRDPDIGSPANEIHAWLLPPASLDLGAV